MRPVQADLQAIADILHNYPAQQRYSLAMLQDMQRHFNYIPREGMEALAEYLESAYSLEVRDSHTAAVYLSGNRALEADEAAAGIAWYSYIGSERMTFSAVLRQGDEEPATEEREWVLQDGEWKG